MIPRPTLKQSTAAVVTTGVATLPGNLWILPPAHISNCTASLWFVRFCLEACLCGICCCCIQNGVFSVKPSCTHVHAVFMFGYLALLYCTGSTEYLRCAPLPVATARCYPWTRPLQERCPQLEQKHNFWFNWSHTSWDSMSPLTSSYLPLGCVDFQGQNHRFWSLSSFIFSDISSNGPWKSKAAAWATFHSGSCLSTCCPDNVQFLLR